jgi:phospholipid/cholesterol/gamma-HCH transport system substrate-binding protein
VLKRKHEIKIALTVIVSIVLFIWGFNFLKGKDIFSKQRTFYSIYPQVNGLVEDAPVLINGLKVGQIYSIYLHPDNSGRIVVKFLVNIDYKLPVNTVAKIVNTDLIGSKAIELKMGNQKKYLNDNDTMIAEIQTSFTEIVNKKLAQIDSIFTSIGSVLGPENQEHLTKSLKSLTVILKNLETTSYQLNNLMSNEKSRLSEILANLESISKNLRNNNAKLNNIFTNFSTLSDTLAKSEIKSTIANINSTTGNLSAVLDKINKGEGSFGLLVNDDTLYNRLTVTSLQLNKLLEDVRLNPKRYVHYSLFGRKDKVKDKKKDKKQK